MSTHAPHSPSPSVPGEYLRNFAVGFASFIALCGVKTLFMMAEERRSRNWTTTETERFLDVLIDRKSKMGDAALFTEDAFNGIALLVSPDRSGRQLFNKWQSVCWALF